VCALSQCVCINDSASLWICGRVRIPADRPELKTCGQPMDRAERREQGVERVDGAAHRLTTLSGLSPTYPQAQQQIVFMKN
jgi:hypothetical protein